MERRDQNEGWMEDSSFFLEPGAVFFSRGGGMVRTVVGNGGVVCLWDRVTKSGGMTYYLYPSTEESGKATAQYGNAALIALIRMMEEAGSQKSDMSAQIIGGASPEDQEDNHLGEKNTAFAKAFLLKKGIKIMSEDIGGHMGRKIMFDVATGHAAVYKVHQIRETDWYHHG